MLEKAKRFLQISIGSTIGVYLGHSFWQWRDYQAHPDLYAMGGGARGKSLLAGGGGLTPPGGGGRGGPA